MTNRDGHGGVFGSLRGVAGFLATLCMLLVFGLFVVGIAMRYLANHPLNWIDEAVTLLSVWGTFWTAAFVIRWPEHIAFDVLFNALSAEKQRICLLAGAVGFIVLIGAAMPGMVDYTLFLWRERTDAMQIRMDFVVSIFPFFFAVILIRLAFVVRNLVGNDWRRELAHWAGGDTA